MQRGRTDRACAWPRPRRRYAFGECYYEVTKDQAEELLDAQKDKVAAEMETLEQEVSGIQASLADLKAKLYGRAT